MRTAPYPEFQKSRGPNKAPLTRASTERELNARGKWAQVKADALRMLVDEGRSYTQISEALGIGRSALYKYMSRESTVEDYKRALQVAAMARYAKALSKLEEQIDSDNGWLAQGAAQRLAAACGPAALGADSNQGITVRVEGIAGLGMPGRAAPGLEEAADAADELNPLGLLEAAGLEDGDEPQRLPAAPLTAARAKPDGRGARRAAPEV
jgi:transposase-like protein